MPRQQVLTSTDSRVEHDVFVAGFDKAMDDGRKKIGLAVKYAGDVEFLIREGELAVIEHRKLKERR